ncbi:Spy/CpxP family protein refolding chaperone [Desulfomonile tiedjei]|uniref:P pilus assembly/Cpx signaling pathway, periplasmic inhibitor/zinc-resistance associated protein n=1 Tax=Desulfomonile tiedjei (strain ATCC 49306 / DSM 6799 / DCB-1) TaxID=706587 RepID=I4C552_DESTA|nr:Spy/CpxP family protein refolding chaperone [Desulfomonile tiedjei]AFM24693.1 P pilus assembly/Cpx signaling pathway, periplasmic inhibitor/zinc-resistance associated protein [Desulfomonile tiedjei DSM 6799]
MKTIFMLMFTLVLAFALITPAVYAQQSMPAKPAVTPQEKGKSHEMGQDQTRHDTKSGEKKTRLWDELSPEQRNKIKQARLETAKKMEGLRSEIGKRRIELMELRFADKPDYAAIDKKRNEIMDLRDEMRKVRRHFKQSVLSVLTPEQREKHEKRFAEHGGMMGMGKGMHRGHGMMGGMHGMMGDMDGGMMGGRGHHGMGGMRGMSCPMMGKAMEGRDEFGPGIGFEQSAGESTPFESGMHAEAE